ncbi:ParB/RepB/Spo0J family partition protein [Actinomadura rupiterrae]|uniref:ParB/RepB/Spo0J family partition protein n=1 Tax=Actinomadura rupiterrae TaxID=559627 RepID=UPI0020A34A7D|nr:ParB/RepB/Spo0J family partition protein [Actinomadura rupiterrae]MCP2337905.1 ParB family chromosome partitioning protein [Actinomadura rupiterrae]
MSSNAYLDLDLIHPHPANVRESLGDLTELADSIRAQGLLQPLVVRPHPTRQGHFELLAGHRRYAAARQAGKHGDRVPVVVRHAVSDAQAIELMLVENCQRVELNPMEKAEAIESLLHRGYSQADVCKATGFASGTVSGLVALLDLDDRSRAKVRTGEITSTEAVAAVRRTRAKQRSKSGKPATWEWEPDYLTGTHPLAKAARKLCDAREHTMRRRIGKTACGQCWETAIRQDERLVHDTTTLRDAPTVRDGQAVAAAGPSASAA